MEWLAPEEVQKPLFLRDRRTPPGVFGMTGCSCGGLCVCVG